MQHEPIPIQSTIAVSFGLPTFDRLLVRLEIEVDEETEVAGKQRATKDSSPFASRTVAQVRQNTIIICRSEVHVRCKRRREYVFTKRGQKNELPTYTTDKSMTN